MPGAAIYRDINHLSTFKVLSKGCVGKSLMRRNAGQYVSKMFGLIRGITAQVFRKPDYLFFF
jgi:hypothetical protein